MPRAVVRAGERRFRGEPAVEIVSGDLAAVFTPGVGMTGVSLRYRGGEHLALPRGLDGLRAGRTGGLPLLAPWANRLSRREYRAAGVAVDLTGIPLGVDDNDLPIHGFLVGRPGWSVDALRTRGESASVLASIPVDAPAFPFPHRIEVRATVRGTRLRVDTTLVPTGRRRVPVAFGWHPYLRLPGTPRRRWTLGLPARRHLALDPRGIPTGTEQAEPAEQAPIGARTFDDGYALGRVRRLVIEDDDGGAVVLRCDAGYPNAQVWVPAGKPFVALEPMTGPTDALVAGTTPLVAPGDAFRATFSLTLDHGA